MDCTARTILRRFVSCLFGILVMLPCAKATAATPGDVIFESGFDAADLVWERGGDGTVVPRISGMPMLADTGRPELPGRPLTLLVPVETAVGTVEIVPLSTRTIAVPGAMALAAPLYSSENVATPQSLHGEIVGGVFPSTWGRDGGSHMMRGFRLVTVMVYPLRARLDEHGEWREVDLLERFAVRLLPTSGATPPSDEVVRLRRVDGERERAERMLRSVIDNPDDLAGYQRQDGATVESAAKVHDPSRTPSLSGSAVSYLIITSEALATAFQPLADHHTASGMPAVIKTIEWIEANYRHGVDVQETLRLFIRDAYERWGVEYVLMGGDTDVVPARYALNDFYPVNGSTEIPADLYFACLDGNWNADGDMIFGEVGLGGADIGDDCDMASEISFGRAPVSNVADVIVFVDKVIGYETAPAGAEYGSGLILAAEVLFYDDDDEILFDGADFAETLMNTVVAPCSDMTAARMYQSFDEEDEFGQLLYPGSIRETASAVLDSLETGRFGILNQIGHGFFFNMSMGTGEITVNEADAMVNENHFLMYALNCASAGFDYSCLMERLIQNPTGGSFASIGASRAAFPSTANDFQLEFFRLLMCVGEHRLGDLMESSRLPWLILTNTNSYTRWTYLNYTLLGDPAQSMWTAAPAAVDIAAPVNLTTGARTVEVTVTAGGIPVPGAVVSAKEVDGLAYAHGITDGAGRVDLPLVLVDEGDLRLTVSGANIARDVLTIPIDTPATYIALAGMTVIDDGSLGSDGDGDGLIDAGETVALLADFADTGGGGASVSSATLGTTAVGVTLVAATVPLPAVPPGGGVTASAPFLVSFDADMADGTNLAFSVDVTDGVDTWPSPWSATVLAPELEPTALVWSDQVYGDGNGDVGDGERITFEVRLKNYGAGTANTVMARLRTNTANVTLYDSLNTYVDIALLEETGGASLFSMAVVDMALPYDARVEFEDEQGRTLTHTFLFDRPSQPQDLAAGLSLGANVIELEWSPVGDPANLGYHVYRSDNAIGPFERVNPDLLLGTSYYRDTGLDLLTRYYYQVSAVDSSLVEGEPSTTFEKSTAPPEMAGYPLPFTTESRSHCAVGDVTGDQRNEVVFAADEIYVWTAEGGELFDGDLNAQTLGPITDLNGRFTMGVALAELDGSPGLEIVASDRDARLIYIFRSDGTILDGWPQSTGSHWVWAPPAIGDIDGDGDPEIVCNNLSRMTLAWHVDGTEVRDGDGNPSTNGPLIDRTSELSWAGWNRSGPALYDLDHDGKKDIIFGTRYGWEAMNSLRAYRWNGTTLDGFPVETAIGGSIMTSPTVADLDVDGIWEIIFVSEDDKLHVVHEDGSYYDGFPIYFSSHSESGDVTCPSPAVGDFDGDGELEIVAIAVHNNLESYIHVVDTDIAGGTSGQTMSGWPYQVPGNSESSPVVGDIDGDGMLDIVFGIGGGDTESPNNLYAFTHDGQDVAGFPLTLGGPIRPAPVICDLDDDQDVDIVYGGGDLQIHVWDMPAAFDIAMMPWPTICGNNFRDGVYREPPAVVEVTLENTSLPHTDDFVKDGDVVTLTARVYGAFDPGDVVADLSPLGGAPAAIPSTSVGDIHTWALTPANCGPQDGALVMTVTVTDELGRDATGDGIITADNTPPEPLLGLAAVPGHNRVDLSWPDPTGTDTHYRGLVVRYDRWHGYPTYPPQDEPDYPSDQLGGEDEAFRGLGEVAEAVHETTDEDRDVYYFSAFAFDEALNHGLPDENGDSNARAVSYLLGDVHDTNAPGQYDGLVGGADVSTLGFSYGCTTGETYFNAECDVGPTHDYTRLDVPVPDGAVQFMDLMIFAMNYGIVPVTKTRPIGTAAPLLAWEQSAPGAWRLRLTEPCADLKGVSLQATVSGGGAVSVRAGGLIEDQTQPVFLANAAPEGLDAAFALLGEGCGIVGAGVLLEISASPEAVLTNVVIDARGIDNLSHSTTVAIEDEAPPSALHLWQNQPNPFNPTTTLRYAVPVAEHVNLAIYTLDGRRVRTLVDGWKQPGHYRAVWDGRNDEGRSLASGAYLCRLRAEGVRMTRKLMLVR